MKSSGIEDLAAPPTTQGHAGEPAANGGAEAVGPVSAASPVPASAEPVCLAQSGFDLDAVYGPETLVGFDPAEQLGAPGEFPYTRGVYPSMYRGRPWTIREYAGFGSASETNRRFRNLIAEGETGLSVAFDLPTQMGYDSDHPLARGEVGKVGVAIDSLADMRTLFDGIRLDQVSTSMTINAPAAPLLLLYQLVAEEQGVDVRRLAGTIQNDILKEYIARGTYIFPPRPSLRLTTDIFAYCQAELPRWNTISISGYHMAEAGANPAQEVAFTLSNAIEYVRAALAGGLEIDEFGPRLSFFFVARSTLLEEVAKFRAARRLWARIMRDRFEAKDPRSLRLRFHTQTAGVELTAQQPEVNLIRVTLAALAAILGGTQSLHTNSYDEAIALPTDHAARLAVRTQQVLAYETDVTRIVDPLGGSYAIERITDQIEVEAMALINKIEDLGGAAAAIEQRLQTTEIDRSAYRVTQETESGQRVVIGVNRFQSEEEEPYERLRIDERIESEQVERLGRVRAARSEGTVAEALQAVKDAAKGTNNLVYPMRRALVADATVGEVCDALRTVWGTYDA
jgi:methylmalonyl-CoA mutase N-terminal domain/subunit